MTDKKTLKTIKSPLKKAICILAMKHWKWLKKRLEQTMTDKENQTPCDTCKVEPPALKFKCPTCEHNPDKEQVIIDGVNVSECLLYMNKFCIRTKCKCNAICDYASYVLRRQLKSKEQECEKLNKWIPIVTRLEEHFGSQEEAKGICYKTYTEQVFAQLDQLKAENQGFKILHESDKALLKIQKETCEKLKREIENLKEYYTNCFRNLLQPVETAHMAKVKADFIDTYLSSLLQEKIDKLTDELKIAKGELKICESKNTTLYLEKCDLIDTKTKLNQALIEIKKIAQSTLDCGEWIGQGDNKIEQILQTISEVENDNA